MAGKFCLEESGVNQGKGSTGVMSLFRREALDHKRHRFFGELIVQKPLSFTVLSIAAVAVLAAIVSFLGWGQYARKQTVQGYLVPSNGLVKVYAPEAGVIVERHVQDGAEVKRGDVLFVVSMEHGSSQDHNTNDSLLQDSAAAKTALTQQIGKTRQLGQVQQAQARAHIASLGQELRETLEQRETEQGRIAISQKELDKFGLLKDKALVSDTQYQEQHDKVLSEQFELQSLDKTVIDLQRQIEDAQTAMSSTVLQTASQVAEYQKDLAQQDQSSTEITARKDEVIQATVDGVATSVLADTGQEVNPNLPLMAILPKGSALEARLFVPTRAIGFVQKGQQVLLRYDAFPYQSFGLYQGTVEDISQSIVNPNELPVPVALSEPVYPVTVRLDQQGISAYGKQMSLQAGMVLEADVILDRQRLIHWVLEPLYRIKGHL